MTEGAVRSGATGDRDVAAVVVAGGSARRFGGVVPKQFLELAGRPVWRRSVDAFLAHPQVREVVLVHPEGWEAGGVPDGLRLVIGGDSRFASMARGVQAARSSTYVAVHDAARPLVTNVELNAVFAAARDVGAAVLARPVTGTTRYARAGRLAETVDRTSLHEMQTPQVARRDWLTDAIRRVTDVAAMTDEAAVLQAAGYPVAVAEGSLRNLKITTPDDFAIAAALLSASTADVRRDGD